MTHDECSQEELEDFAKWMAIAKEIMRTDRDLLLQLRGLDEVKTMTPQIDPMSAEAQGMMEAYADVIVRNAIEKIDDRKRQLQALNDQRTEE